jgi:hypothetical protein
MKVTTIGCLAFGLAAGSLSAAEYPEAAISNGQIRAQLYLPDAANGYYRGTRFDWSGVIYSLKYQGHDYYGPWYQKRSPDVKDFIYQGPDIVTGPCSSITGPVEEYSTGGKALGYDEAAAGGTFIKIGVGVLRKPDATAYDHYRNYEMVDPGKWSVHTGPDRVEFVQELSGPNGYAYIYSKTVRLMPGKPEMVLEHSLKNTGKRAIASDAYNHNFLVLDQQAPGPGYSIKFPFEIKSNRPITGDLAAIRGDQIVYEKTLRGEDRVTTPIQGFGSSPKDYDIHIENSAVGAGLRITADRPILRASLWSIRSVVAVEPYIDIAIEPGQEFTWKFTYDYYTTGVKVK